MEVLRELSIEDLATPKARPNGTIDRLRGLHHAQARLIAAGKTPGQVSSMLGTSRTVMDQLTVDPAFQELVEYYKDQGTVVWLENEAKAAVVGRLAMDILQEKLETEGTRLSVRELKEVATDFGDRSDYAKKTGQQQAPGAAVITFNFGELKPAEGRAALPMPLAITLEGQAEKAGG